MPNVHGKSSKLLLAATEITGFFREAEATSERDLHDVTMFGGDGGHKFFPGLLAGGLTLGGLFDPTADALLEPYLTASAPAEEPVVFAPEGFAAGNRVRFGLARSKSYKTSGPATDMVAASLDVQADPAGIYTGLSAGPPTSRAASATVVLDRGAGAPTALHRRRHHERRSLQRAAFMVSSSVLPTTGSMYVNVAHSADNVTYVGLSVGIAWGPAAVGGIANHPNSHGGMNFVTTPQTLNRYIQFTVLAGSAPTPGFPTVLHFAAAVFS